MILSPKTVATLLDSASEGASLAQLMAPAPAEWITAYPVVSYVDNTRYEGTRCMDALADAN